MSSRLRSRSGILVLLVFLAACGAPAETSNPPRPIEAVEAGLGDVVETVSVVGEIEADVQARVNPELPERIERVHVRLGDRVTRGTPLVTLSGETYAAGLGQASASLEAAQAARELARSSLERVRVLFEAGTASQADFDNATNQLRSAEAQVRQLQNVLSQAAVQKERSVVTAPFDGIVASLDAKPGDIASPGRPLVVLVQPGSMRAELQVPERHFHRIRPGMKARVWSLADPDVEVQGEVSAVGGFIDPVSRTGEVDISVPDADGALVAGSAVRVEIEIGRRAGVLMLPVQAVQFAADVHLSGKATVYVVEDDVAHAREVKVGHREPESVEILEGVRPGEVVATMGAHLLRDGARVSIEEPRQ